MAGRRRQSEFIQVRSPFDGLDEEGLREVRSAIAEKAQEAFGSTTATIQALIGSTPTRRVLGDLAFQFYMNQEGLSSGKDYAIEQHHVEYAQAVALRAGQVVGGPDPYSGPAINLLIVALREQTSASSMQDWPQADLDAASMARFEVLDAIRRFTQDVRGDFNAGQFDRFMRGILTRIDARFAQIHGIAATTLIDMLSVLLLTIEGRLATFQRGIGHLRRARRGGKAVSTYFRFFPVAARHREQVIANARLRSVPQDQMGQYLFGQAYNQLPECFSFDMDDVDAALPEGASREAALAAIRRWTIAFGELAELKPERLLIDNPVRSRPFVNVDDGSWMWPSPGTLFSNGIDMVELLIGDDGALKEAYSTARASYLEEEVARLFRTHLPSARVWTSVRWRDDETRTPYETDLVARIDDLMIVVEAKSGQLNDASRRGADASLRREIRKLMVEPAVQSARFVEYLRTRGPGEDLPCAEGGCRLDFDGVRQVVRLTVALETPGPLATAWTKLVEAGIVPADVEHAPVVGLSDLEVLFELLSDEATILHYLLRRTDFERSADFMADEHDLIAFYLRGGFAMAAVEEGEVWLNAYGMSDMLRGYYSRAPGGKRPPKPAPLRSERWSGWVREICRRQPRRWTTMAAMLLDVDHSAQEAVGYQLDERVREVRGSRRLPAFRAALVRTGPRQRVGAVIPLAYRGLSQPEIVALTQDLYVRAKEELGTERVLIVGVDVDNPRPYAFIALHVPDP